MTMRNRVRLEAARPFKCLQRCKRHRVFPHPAGASSLMLSPSGASTNALWEASSESNNAIDTVKGVVKPKILKQIDGKLHILTFGLSKY